MDNKVPARPICEECDFPMHEFAAPEGDFFVSGWGCDECGWSFDNYRERIAPAKEA